LVNKWKYLLFELAYRYLKNKNGDIIDQEKGKK